MEKNVSSDCIKPVHNGNWFMWFIKKNSVNKAVWQRDKILYGQFKNRFIVHSIVQCMCRSDIIDYLIHPLGVQYNNGFLEVWPSQMVEDSPRFMSQLRASVVSPDRRIILWFKLGKYWSRGPQWQASRPEIEGNGLLCRVKKKGDKWGSAKYTILTIKLDNTSWGNIYINSQASHLELLHALLSVEDCLVALSIQV